MPRSQVSLFYTNITKRTYITKNIINAVIYNEIEFSINIIMFDQLLFVEVVSWQKEYM